MEESQTTRKRPAARADRLQQISIRLYGRQIAKLEGLVRISEGAVDVSKLIRQAIDKL